MFLPLANLSNSFYNIYYIDMATKKTSAKSTAAKKPASKPAKKSTAKTTAKVTKTQEPKTVAEKKVDAPAEKASTASTNGGGFRMKKSYVILVVVIVLLGALLYFFRSLFVAAVVNGQPISRLSVVQEAEKQSGKQVLTTLVRNTLIEQEARKENVTVSDQEINDEIKKLQDNLQKQGQKLDQVLAMQGMSQADLRKLIRLDKLVGKMVGKDIKITDQQVTDYIEKNKEALPQGENESELKNTVRDQLKQQQLNDKVRTWLEQLQSKAKITRFVNY
jgi:foldase protein PrsA